MAVIPHQWLRDFPDNNESRVELGRMFRVLSEKLTDDQIREIFRGTVFEEDLE